MFLAVRLAKSGYYGGDPDKVLQAPTDSVMQILKYEAEEKIYLQCYKELNKS